MKQSKLMNDLRLHEDFIYNYKLDSLTKFNIINNLAQKKIFKISLNFGFKNINFDKKKMIPFFMILELISNQKSYITFSKKHVLSIKIKKGTITGCKVTLRNKNLFNFLDSLVLGLPRYEDFKGFRFNKKNKKVNNIKINISDLFIFHTIESELVNYIKYLDVNFIFNTVNNDEKIFLLTYNKIPLLLK